MAVSGEGRESLSGAPLLEVEVHGNHVRVSAHEAYLREGLDPENRSAQAESMLDMLASGVELELKVDKKASEQRRWSEP